MSTQIPEKISEFIEEIKAGNHYPSFLKYMERIAIFIKYAINENTSLEFKNLIKENNFLLDKNSVLGFLDALVINYSPANSDFDGIRSPHLSIAQPIIFDKTKVFIVHGYDAESKETVARFAQNIGLEPIILHEQPSQGLTIIEKLEHYGNVGFAIVLLTPDDIGAPVISQEEQKFRARQNVILELGFFIGKLSRNRVCVLYKSDVEIPSDYSGVVYIELDEPGAWKTKLSQELINSGMQVNIEGLFS